MKGSSAKWRLGSTLLMLLALGFMPLRGAEAEGSAPAQAGLKLNFRGAPVDEVLDYLADAAGFVINRETQLRGTVDMWSKDAVTPDEAYQLLHSALKKNGYAVTRNGRILSVFSLESAKTADLPVSVGNDPGLVTKSDETVTQVIPILHVNAAQLVANLQPLLPVSATLSANESANSIILVATKTELRRILNVVKALDTAIVSVSSMRVFLLRYADAKQLATVVQQLFAPVAGRTSQTIPGGFQPQQQTPGQFGAPFGFGGAPSAGPPGANSAGGNAGTTGRTTAANVAVAADDSSNSLIVRAAPEVLTSVASIVSQLDRPVSAITELRVFTLRNADPAELADQLGVLFPDDSKNSSSATSAGFRFGGPPFGPPGMFSAGSAETSSTSRSKNRVLAVPDARSSSLIVSAPTTLMPQIAQLVAQLDASSARKEMVQVWDLRNANPNEVSQILQDLFNRNSSMRTTTSRNGSGNQDDALVQRQTQQQQFQNNSGNTGFNLNRSGGAGGGGLSQ